VRGLKERQKLKETIAEKIKKLIFSTNRKNHDVANQIGVTPQTLSKWINCYSDVPYWAFPRLATCFDVDIDYFYEFPSSKNNKETIQQDNESMEDFIYELLKEAPIELKNEIAGKLAFKLRSGEKNKSSRTI
jgi:transposase-like protein